MVKFSKTIGLVAFIFTLNACGNNTSKEEKSTKEELKQTTDTASVLHETPAKTPEVDLPEASDRQYDDFARFIAALTQRDSASKLSKLEKEETWTKFAKKFDSSWAILDKTRLSKMRTWRDQEIKAANETQNDLLYAFSGPDFLNGFTLFPNATNYTLIALEPVGQIKDFNANKPEEVTNYLNSVDESLNDIFEKSYFITRKMLQHLQRDKVDGTLPLMCLFLARTGNKILDIKKVNIDSTGNFNENNWEKGKRTSVVKIYFVHPDDPNRKRSLTYIKADMLDANIKKNKPLLSYLNNLGEVNAYLKSASYLLHYRDFSVIRDIILKKSNHILQDDTGIAYRFYKQNEWQFVLYGKYAKPVKDFAGVDQVDLKKAYADSTKIKPLPFSLGYHWGTKDQNLMFASKIKK